ncbi:MAG: hypothetical protein ABIJ92_02940 [Candidatus Aenigmatarchaeota archaeon]
MRGGEKMEKYAKIAIIIVAALVLIISAIFYGNFPKCAGDLRFTEIVDLNRSINNSEEAYNAFNEFYKTHKGRYAHEYGLQKEDIEFKEITVENGSQVSAWVLITDEAVDNLGKIYVQEYCA